MKAGDLFFRYSFHDLDGDIWHSTTIAHVNWAGHGKCGLAIDGSVFSASTYEIDDIMKEREGSTHFVVEIQRDFNKC